MGGVLDLPFLDGGRARSPFPEILELTLWMIKESLGKVIRLILRVSIYSELWEERGGGSG